MHSVDRDAVDNHPGGPFDLHPKDGPQVSPHGLALLPLLVADPIQIAKGRGVIETSNPVLPSSHQWVSVSDDAEPSAKLVKGLWALYGSDRLHDRLIIG